MDTQKIYQPINPDSAGAAGGNRWTVTPARRYLAEVAVRLRTWTETAAAG